MNKFPQWRRREKSPANCIEFLAQQQFAHPSTLFGARERDVHLKVRTIKDSHSSTLIVGHLPALFGARNREKKEYPVLGCDELETK